MFKKTLIAAAALSTLVLGASAANAHGHHGHFGHGSNFVLELSDYDDDCFYKSRPVTIKVWDDYSDSYYFKTVYRQVRVCD